MRRTDAQLARRFPFCFRVAAWTQHEQSHHDHHQSKQEQQVLASDQKSEAGAQHRSRGPHQGEDDGAAPPYMSLAGMAGESGIGIDRHGERARSDRDMRIGDTDRIEKQRRGED